MADMDWSRFAVRINVKAPARELYRCWATRAGIESWFLRRADYKKANGEARTDEEAVEKGDSYQWYWYGYGDDTTESGEILECDGADLFRFSFGKAGICTVRLYEEEGEQLVELVQEEIPVDEKGKQYYHVGCKTGWTFYLANLKSILEGGIDLRNKNEKLRRMLNA
ncbi:MAG: SRPBCC domain-containing protein [Chitinophagaceae bacterium]